MFLDKYFKMPVLIYFVLVKMRALFYYDYFVL